MSSPFRSSSLTLIISGGGSGYARRAWSGALRTAWPATDQEQAWWNPNPRSGKRQCSILLHIAKVPFCEREETAVQCSELRGSLRMGYIDSMRDQLIMNERPHGISWTRDPRRSQFEPFVASRRFSGSKPWWGCWSEGSTLHRDVFTFWLRSFHILVTSDKTSHFAPNLPWKIPHLEILLPNAEKTKSYQRFRVLFCCKSRFMQIAT